MRYCLAFAAVAVLSCSGRDMPGGPSGVDPTNDPIQLLIAPSFSVAKNGAGLFGVNVARTKCSGPVTVVATGVPTGVTIPNAAISMDPGACHQSPGSILIQAGPSSSPGTYTVTLSASGPDVVPTSKTFALTVADDPQAAASLELTGRTSFAYSPLSPSPQSAGLAARARLHNGTYVGLTSEATWQSSNVSVVTVDNTGAVSAVGAGEADVTVSYQGLSASLRISVSGAPLSLSGSWSGTVFGALGASNLSGPMTLNVSHSGVSLSATGAFGTSSGFQLQATVTGAIITVSGPSDSFQGCPVKLNIGLSATNTHIYGFFTKTGGCNNSQGYGSFVLTR